eukprot:TRINITY_DN3285_c0_g1_i3.p1 TRINITY_DN3285_c0_g1~~TRINITY_DN3285_c0_g1_i3.p1  ORF type:complete len:620 (+),score=39.45 TRINITY_DN3285_c0_g1_i3:102-1961(+)
MSNSTSNLSGLAGLSTANPLESLKGIIRASIMGGKSVKFIVDLYDSELEYNDDKSDEHWAKIWLQNLKQDAEFTKEQFESTVKQVSREMKRVIENGDILKKVNRTRQYQPLESRKTTSTITLRSSSPRVICEHSEEANEIAKRARSKCDSKAKNKMFCVAKLYNSEGFLEATVITVSGLLYDFKRVQTSSSTHVQQPVEPMTEYDFSTIPTGSSIGVLSDEEIEFVMLKWKDFWRDLSDWCKHFGRARNRQNATEFVAQCPPFVDHEHEQMANIFLDDCNDVLKRISVVLKSSPNEALDEWLGFIDELHMGSGAAFEAVVKYFRDILNGDRRAFPQAPDDLHDLLFQWKIELEQSHVVLKKDNLKLSIETNDVFMNEQPQNMTKYDEVNFMFHTALGVYSRIGTGYFWRTIARCAEDNFIRWLMSYDLKNEVSKIILSSYDQDNQYRDPCLVCQNHMAARLLDALQSDEETAGSATNPSSVHENEFLEDPFITIIRLAQSQRKAMAYLLAYSFMNGLEFIRTRSRLSIMDKKHNKHVVFDIHGDLSIGVSTRNCLLKPPANALSIQEVLHLSDNVELWHRLSQQTNEGESSSTSSREQEEGKEGEEVEEGDEDYGEETE